MPGAKWFNEDGSRMLCSIEDCGRPIKALGYCHLHFQRLKKHGSTDKPIAGRWKNADGTRKICSLDECDKPVKGHGWCRRHLAQTWAGKEPYMERVFNPEPCSVDGCARDSASKGYCNMHYIRSVTGFVGEAEPRVKRQSSTVCLISGCEKKSVALSLCNAHWRYHRVYNLPVEVVENLFRPENYKCSNTGCERVSDLVLDHDHSCCSVSGSCGKCVRGWLCRKCNGVLGMADDRLETLLGLVEYLENWRGYGLAD